VRLNGSLDNLNLQLDQVSPTQRGSQTGILRLIMDILSFLFINGCNWLYKRNN